MELENYLFPGHGSCLGPVGSAHVCGSCGCVCEGKRRKADVCHCVLTPSEMLRWPGCACTCLPACLRVRVHARAGARVCMRAPARGCMHACASACVPVHCVQACACAHECMLDFEVADTAACKGARDRQGGLESGPPAKREDSWAPRLVPPYPRLYWITACVCVCVCVCLLVSHGGIYCIPYFDFVLRLTVNGVMLLGRTV